VIGLCITTGLFQTVCSPVLMYMAFFATIVFGPGHKSDVIPSIKVIVKVMTQDSY
jgi:hypothetical protein